jgi:F0F1-type ATP synthase assembly protein I
MVARVARCLARGLDGTLGARRRETAPSMNTPGDLRSQLMRSMALSTAIGLDIACVLLTSTFVGWYIDGKLGSGPVGLLLGISFGLAGGGYSAYVLVRRVLH